MNITKSELLEVFYDDLAENIAGCVICTFGIGYDGFDNDKAKDILKSAFAEKDARIAELEAILENSH